MVVGQAAGHRLTFLRRPQGHAKGPACDIKKNSALKSKNGMAKGQRSEPPILRKVLTCQEDSELPVVELRLLLGQQAALGALAHRVHETHAGQRHLPAAAFIAETAAAAPTVVLQEQADLSVVFSGTERRGQISSAGSDVLLRQEGQSPAKPTTEAAAAICGNSTDLSLDEVKLGVTLHASGTLAEGKRKNRMLHNGAADPVSSSDSRDLATRTW